MASSSDTGKEIIDAADSVSTREVAVAVQKKQAKKDRDNMATDEKPRKTRTVRVRL